MVFLTRKSEWRFSMSENVFAVKIEFENRSGDHDEWVKCWVGRELPKLKCELRKAKASGRDIEWVHLKRFPLWIKCDQILQLVTLTTGPDRWMLTWTTWFKCPCVAMIEVKLIRFAGNGQWKTYLHEYTVISWRNLFSKLTIVLQAPFEFLAFKGYIFSSEDWHSDSVESFRPVPSSRFTTSDVFAFSSFFFSNILSIFVASHASSIDCLQNGKV